MYKTFGVAICVLILLIVPVCSITYSLSNASKYKRTILFLKKQVSNADHNIVIDEKIIEWAYKNANNRVPKIEVVRYLQEMSKYGNFLMLASVVQVESGFYLYAASDKGAKGLGQITSNIWAKELVKVGIWDSKVEAYNYRKNIAATNYILEKYLKEFGSWKECLNRYVGGDYSYTLKVLSNYAELTLLMEQEGGK